MQFDYVIDHGIWNSNTHQYMPGAESEEWNYTNFTSENNQVKVTNRSNIPVNFDIDVVNVDSYGLDIMSSTNGSSDLKRFTEPITLYPQIDNVETDIYYVYITGDPIDFNHKKYTQIGNLVLTVDSLNK